MTTFQDPQPQSRRAVRQSERGDAPEQPEAFSTPAQAAPQFYPDSSTSREMWDTTARRAAQLPPTPPASPRSDAPAAASGRRAAQAHGVAPAAEPLSYSTPAAPAESAQSTTPTFRPRGTSAGTFDAQARPREFSPLDHQTEARLHYEVPVAPISEIPPYIAPPRPVEPVAATLPPVDLLPPSAPGGPIEQTLTRRELRAIQQAEALAGQSPAAERQFPPPPEPSTRTPPTGHWSVEIARDGDEVYQTTVNRPVGSASAATNALVLPSVPDGHDIRGPLTRTGEVMLTGSIDLPRSFSSTGASARFDHDGIDSLFDAGDAEVISTDSAPVRAVTAVSTHNSGQGVTHTQKPKGNRALTALLIAASSMAVIVAGLLITAFALNMF